MTDVTDKMLEQAAAEEEAKAAEERRQNRIDAAIERQYERQHRSRIIILALLVFAFLAALAVLRFGQTKTEIVVQEVVSDPVLAKSIASTVVQDSATVESLVASDALAWAVDDSSRRAVTRFAREPVFAEAVRGAFGEGPDALRNDIDANRVTIRQFAEQLVSTPGTGDFAERFERLEKEQLRLATAMGDQAKLSNELSTLRDTVDKLQSDLEKSRFEIRELERGGNGNRSYLLREDAPNSLPDIGLRVILGRQIDGRIDSVLVEDRSGPLDITVSGGIELGKPFDFKDSEGRVFRATFSYTQSRFWARDYVGLEIEELSGR